jgi:hypothetical protein
VDEVGISRLVLEGRSVTRGNNEVASRIGSVFVADGVRSSDWTSVPGMLLVMSEGCTRGSVVMEDASSSTELMTGSWTESVEVASVGDSVWIAVVSKREVDTLWIADETRVVKPSTMSGVDVSMLDGFSEVMKVDKTGTSMEVTTLL